MINTISKENKMGIMPVNKLLISMSLPMIISMLVQALYNVVDSVFVAQISEDALTAVSLAFPIQNLMIAVGNGTAVGVNALLSMSLGQKNQENVNKSAVNGLFLSICSFAVFFFIGLFGSRLYFESQTSNPIIIKYGVEYLSICTMGSFGIFSVIMLDRLLQSTGKTFYTMITQTAGAITNIIFDPLFIFGLLGFPKLGVAGAAIATVLGQMVGFSLSIYFNLKKNNEINFLQKSYRPDGQIIAKIYKVGVPSIILGSIGSVMTYGMNLILASFTTTAVAIFGIYFKLNSFIFMPVFGLNNGLVPIVAFNYGARKKSRITSAIKYAALYASCIMLIGFILFQFAGGKLLTLFNASDAMLAIGIPALRIIAISFLGAGVCIVFGSVFQALGSGVLSMLVSLVRQLVVLLPVAWLLAQTKNLNFVWWSYPIAEFASLALSSLFMIRIFKTKLKSL